MTVSRIYRLLALATAIVATAGAFPAHAATRAAVCVSTRDPALAATLARAIDGAVRARTDAVAVAVYDRSTGTSCQLAGDAQFDAASVVKVAIMGAVLRQAADGRHRISRRDDEHLHAMITRSDNNAASALWAQVGRGGFTRFLRLAAMTETVPGSGGRWGLTRITARDEMRLLSLLTTPNTVLSDQARADALGLMAQVVAGQRWGVTAGAPGRESVSLKNGWLPERSGGWHINSIGTFSDGRDVAQLVVLTDDNPTFSYGVATVSGVARAVHRTLRA